MKIFKIIITTLTVSMAIFTASAEEKKEKTAAVKERTIHGTTMCAKCTLKETKDCKNALQVKRQEERLINQSHFSEPHQTVGDFFVTAPYHLA
ncbi:MAG: hypothetical protein CMO75_03420 [Verrucomicrobiales bacterium]|nr:hypothetical protein [Verrucomicrobiales bacterium]